MNCLFLVHDGAELVERDGQTALLLIHLFGCAEPKHIFSPFGNRFDIEQVLDTDVFGNAVTAPASATERQGGGHLEVVQVTDAAVRGGRVDENAAGLHGVPRTHRGWASRSRG